MGTTIHQLRAIVTSDIKGFLDGMSKSGFAIVNLRRQFGETAAAINTAALRITGAVAGIGAYAAKSFADFEDAMVEVGAITRTLGTKDFKRLEQAALDMGEKTRYSATQAAEALKQLALAGMGTDQSIAALPPTLELAAAAGLSIAEAAGIAAKTMKAFGMEASQLSHVNDVLVSTFTRSNTSLVQLAEGLKHVAPVAKVLNVSIEETTAVLGKLADAGFQGEMGGTALRNILSRLSGAVPRAVGQLSRLGITTLDSTGKMRPMLDVLQDIENAGLSAGEVMNIFGQRGGPQLLALLEVGIGAVRDFSKETEKAAGVAERMMKARMQTLKGQWDQLTSIIDSTFIDLGSQIAPILTQLINEMERWVAANKADFINTFRVALVSMIDALRQVVIWLQNNKQELWEWAAALGNAVKWIAELVANHPELLAFFAAFQVGRLLGVNDALFKMTGLIASLIVELGRAIIKWYAYAAAAKVAAAAGATGGMAGAVGGLAGGASSLGARAAARGAFGGMAGQIAGGLAPVIGSRITLSGGMFTVIGGAATLAAAKLAVLTLAVGVVAAKLGILEAALVDAAKAAGKSAIDKQLREGKETTAKLHDKQIQDIRNSREEKQPDGTVVDRGQGFVVDQMEARLNEEKQNLADRQAAAQAAQERQRQAQEAHNNALIRGTPAQVTKTEEKLQQANDAQVFANNNLENNRAIVGKFTQAISEELNDSFKQVRDQVKNGELRKTYTEEMEALKKQFAEGALPVEEFRKKIDELTKKLKEADADLSAGTKPFQELAQTKRRMQTGTDKDGNKTNTGVPTDIDFSHFDSMAGAIQQLNTVDKLWAEELAARAEAEMAEVENMRRTMGEVQAVRDAEAALNGTLQAIEAEAHGAVSATLTGNLSKTQKEQALNRRKEAAGGYGEFSDQTDELINNAGGLANGGLKNIGIDAIRQLAEGVEYASQGMKDEFVAKFMALQAAGPQAFAEGIEELTLTYVEAADKLKKNAEALEESLKNLEGPAGMDQRVAELKALNPNDPAYAEYERLKGLAQNHNIDNDVFNQKVGRIGTSLETGQSAREGMVEQRDSTVEAATEKAKEFSEKFGNKFVDGIRSTMDKAVTEFNTKLASLQQEFLESDMSVDEFNRRLGVLQGEFDETGSKALEAAADLQKEQIMKGDYSSLDTKKALEDRLYNYRMQQFNQQVDAMFNAMMGLNNNTKNLSSGFEQANKNLGDWGGQLGSFFEGGFGGGGFGGGAMPDIAGGLAQLNSKQGQIAQLINQISGLAQILNLPNVAGSRKEEVRRQIDELQGQIDFLSNAPPPMFIGQSGDPLFQDPGLIGGGTSGSPQSQAAKMGANKQPVTNNLSFPNLTRLTNADVSQVYDRLQEEAKRRGGRL